MLQLWVSLGCCFGLQVIDPCGAVLGFSDASASLSIFALEFPSIQTGGSSSSFAFSLCPLQQLLALCYFLRDSFFSCSEQQQGLSFALSFSQSSSSVASVV
uniref:Secreted protein n=1 Tax=Setaria viridis TaxID=4556 RepID=A0A4U6WDP1_SETVI|nr:hypothetical protein SEVIR_1G278250v2 [Setaria viridis]